MGSSKYKGSGLKGLHNLNSVKDVGSLLRQLNISPVKALGQNFLRDDGESLSIVESLNCNGDDIVIEIGPGLGALTQYLFGKVKKLILIEFDKNIAELLTEIFYGYDDVEVINEDAVKFSKQNIQKLLNNKEFIHNIDSILGDSIKNLLGTDKK